MNKYKEKLGYILNKIKRNKRILYFSFCTVLVLFCLVLNVTFSHFNRSKNINEANIIIGDLKYKMVINEVELNESVGTKLPSNTIIGDRIILLKAGQTEQFIISLTSKNNFDTKYEIIYKVCTDVNCTSFIDTPANIEIFYHEDMPYISGTINAEKTKEMALVTSNQDDQDYYVQINLNAGYSHNELPAANQIVSSYSRSTESTISPISTINSNISILAYVNGTEVTALPTNDNYYASISCKSSSNNSDIVESISWTGNKWVINVSGLEPVDTVCTVYFTRRNEFPIGWDTAESGTLLAAIRSYYASVTSPITTPGSAVSTSDEALLAATEDDYGISYYFRGAVTNNYVQFANKCWRIVRITGDGSIKLVLHNDNVNNDASPCASTNNAKTAAFAKYTGTTTTSKFNSYSGKNAYVGFMYGTAGSGTYALEHENKNDSTILTNLKTWYNTYLKSYDNKLADTIWCNDKSTYQNTSYNPISMRTIGTEYGVATNANFYSATSRIVSSSNGLGSAATGISPTLVCPNDDNGGNLSKYTSEDTIKGNGALNGYKIGLLTADEIVFAGGAYNTANTTYYLYENANGSSGAYWTSSPSFFSSSTSNASGFIVYPTGYVTHSVVTNSHGVRPSVSLVSSITISGGNGTSSNPFVIN